MGQWKSGADVLRVNLAAEHLSYLEHREKCLKSTLREKFPDIAGDQRENSRRNRGMPWVREGQAENNITEHFCAL